MAELFKVGPHTISFFPPRTKRARRKNIFLINVGQVVQKQHGVARRKIAFELALGVFKRLAHDKFFGVAARRKVALFYGSDQRVAHQNYKIEPRQQAAELAVLLLLQYSKLNYPGGATLSMNPAFLPPAPES